MPGTSRRRLCDGHRRDDHSIIFLLNVGMLVTRLTKTANVDIYILLALRHYRNGRPVDDRRSDLWRTGRDLRRRLVVESNATGRRNGTEHCVGLEGISIPQGYETSSCLDCSYCWMRHTKNTVYEGRNIDAQEDPKAVWDGRRPVIVALFSG